MIWSWRWIIAIFYFCLRNIDWYLSSRSLCHAYSHYEQNTSIVPFPFREIVCELWCGSDFYLTKIWCLKLKQLFKFNVTELISDENEAICFQRLLSIHILPCSFVALEDRTPQGLSEKWHTPRPCDSGTCPSIVHKVEQWGDLLSHNCDLIKISHGISGVWQPGPFGVY